MSCYIFGYGSLICSSSRDLTGITGTAFPCSYQGLKRSWSMPILSMKAVVLVVVQDDTKTCNGVLVQTEESELPKFDAREIGYTRIKLDLKRFHFIECVPKELGEIWVYISSSNSKADTNCKILQSYVDVVLTGCLEYGESFAKEFIDTTYGWDGQWDFDRDKPLYPRALKENTYKSTIDALLKTCR